MRPIRRHDSTVYVRAKFDRRNTGRAFMLWGGLGGLILLLPASWLFVDVSFWAFMFLPFAGACFVIALMGAVMWLFGRTEYAFDEVRQVFRVDKTEYSFSDVVCVRTGAFLTEQSTGRGGTITVQRYQIALVLEVGDEMAADIADIQKTIDKAVAAGESVPEDFKTVLRDIASAAEYELPLTDVGHPMHARQMAEGLSKTLGVPLLEQMGDELVERSPRELDLSLRRRAEVRGHQPQAPSMTSKPASHHVQDDGRVIGVSWTGGNSSAVALFTLLSAFLLAFGLIAWAEGLPNEGLAVMWSTLAILVAVQIYWGVSGRPRQRVEVGPRDVVLRTKLGRSLAVPLAKVEAVCRSTLFHKWVHVVTDDAFLTCQCRDENEAAWLSVFLEDAVYRKQTVQGPCDGPYR